MATVSTATTFLTGYSSRKGLLGLLTFPDALDPKADFCRMYTYLEPNWGRNDLEFQCKSITAMADPARNYRGWWILGKNGEVAEISGGKSRIEYIPGAGLDVETPLGYVEAIKNIAGELYVVGYRRQAYQRVNGQWVSIASDILATRADVAIGFFDIDGVDATHLYAVGWNGEIWLNDGQRWLQDDSPTTVHLNAVRALGPDDIWICGDKGTVLHGRFNRWQRIDDAGWAGNWYSIEEFNGKIYLAGNNVLACIEDGAVKKIEAPHGKPFTVHRLHAKEGLLWSIGRADILVFDGQTWTEVMHPDNKSGVIAR